MSRNRFALDYAGVWREAFGLPYITPDNGIVAYGYSSEYGRIGIYGHVVLDDRMSRAADRLAFIIIAETLCAKCNSLIYTDVITNHSRLTDYHSGAVVYAEIVADFSPGVDVYPRFGMCHFRYHTGHQRETEKVEMVRQTVVQHSPDRRIAENYFCRVLCRRICVIYGTDVCPD